VDGPNTARVGASSPQSEQGDDGRTTQAKGAGRQIIVGNSADEEKNAV